jgi:uncharacterized membrane protein YkgB
MSQETYHILTLIGVVICIVLLLVLVLIPYRRRP